MVRNLITRSVILVIFILAFSWVSSNGQEPTPTPETKPNSADSKATAPQSPDASSNTAGTNQAVTSTDDPATTQKSPKRGTFIPVPIPIVSPTFGSGMVLGLGYVFKLKMADNVSPPSAIGGAFAFTSSGTRAGVIGGRLYFAENKYQTTFAFGKGRAIYDFYGVGARPGDEPVSVELRQSGTVFFGEFMRNIGKNVFIGPRYQYRELTTRLNSVPTPGGFEIPPIDLVSTTSAIGFHVQRDLRDNSFYPTKGSVWSFTGDFFAKALGSNRDYQVYKASYNGYHKIGKGQVLAYRGSACSVSDKTPFFDLCYFGSNSDLRGYTTGEFQDRRMFATQVEYRKELPFRLGLVGFAGFGGVAREWSDFHFDELLPAAGVGIRFKLDKQNHINYRVDFGFGRSGYTVSMSVTEAF